MTKKHLLSILKKIILVSLSAIILLPQSAWAAAIFDPNYIISDNDLTNNNAMSTSQIQKFFTNKNSTLASYTTADPWGSQKTAAQIIYDAAQYWRISPSYILVRMQIEQSLVLDSSPTQYQYDWATGYAVCDSCSTDDPQVRKYKGFFSQINWAARRIRESYLTDLETKGMTLSGWGPGITKTVTDYNGTYTVTPINNATAALYTYTPHVYNANYNIWAYWNRWFTKQYPDGSLLQVQGEKGVYLIQNGKKRPFYSRTALVSRFNPNLIIIVGKGDLDIYELDLPIKFADFSLVRSQETGKLYLISGDQKRYIESPQVFHEIGFNPEEIIVAPEKDLASYELGININMQSIYPTGVLLQSKTTGGISYVENGVKHSIWSKEILKSRFSNRKPVIVEQATIDQYVSSDPIKFMDGTLVTARGASSVYVISNGLKRPIASKQVFDALGYKWSNVIWTSMAALSIHVDGDLVDVSL